MNELETLLRTLTPRRPSPKLKQRIFSANIGVVEDLEVSSKAPPLLHWLAPAMALLLLTCIVLNQHYGSGLRASPGGSAMFAAALSNQSAAAWLPGSFTCEQNRFRANTFEWTNGSSSPPSIHPVSAARREN